MIALSHKLRMLGACAVLTVVAGGPALADDLEIYRTQADALGVKPNVLFIIDTSGSMDTEVVLTEYNPATTYPGSCDASRIYFSGSDAIPNCDNSAYFAATANVCSPAISALAAGGPGVWPARGASLKKMAQYRKDGNNSNNEWRTIKSGDGGYVECADDEGVHGATTNGAKYITNSTKYTGYKTSSDGQWNNIQSTYRLFSANFLNYMKSPTPVIKTRLQIVSDVAKTLAGTLDNVNLGLMRYSWDPDANRGRGTAQGGYILVPVGDIANNRADVLSKLSAFTPLAGDGNTPLSETLYEAIQYWKGKAPYYGLDSKPGQSPQASRVAPGYTLYKSPITSPCQKNFNVYLTDGLPTTDDDVNSTGTSADLSNTLLGRACTVDGLTATSDGICTDDFAGYLNTTDLVRLPSETTANPTKQTVQTYMIGFGTDVQESQDFLERVALAGGTPKAYTATDTETLTAALESIFQDIQQQGSTFVTPQVTINAFNRNQTSDEVYVSLFQADKGEHWPGNLKKYKLVNGALTDSTGKTAITADGYFDKNSRSFWSGSVDGDSVVDGGAASKLAAPSARPLYSSVAGNNITQVSNQLVGKPTGPITDAMVGTGVSTTACSDACQKVIGWARGLNVNAVTGTEAPQPVDKTFMGDPLHARVGIVTYDGTATTPSTRVFVPTNDGFLHAFDAATGEEKWAYIPPELLPRLKLLQTNPPQTQRGYGLDGDIKVLKYDKNQNGIVETPDDFVYLFFGMRMGGNHYYAIDVTDKDKAQLLWNIGPDTLPGVGQTWSPPVIARVNVDDGKANDDKRKFVLIFGGGYDGGQETPAYSTDDVGNRIFMVDASTGKRLWYAGAPLNSVKPDLQLDEMNNSIPAPVSVIDTNGDGFADRMYAGDMGGRVWRFDIFNGQPRNKLVTGGVFARLGAGAKDPISNPPQSMVRRFYNAPDVSLVQQAEQDPYYNIAIGSGYRGHPLNKDTSDAFYSLRDRRPYAQMTTTDWSKYTPIAETDSTLVDLSSNPLTTPVPTAARGWKYHFPTSHAGEKVLANSTTFNNVVLFTTYQHNDGDSQVCYPTSTNRLYAFYASSGKPALDLNKDGKVDGNDVFSELAFKSGIAGGPTVGVDYTASAGGGNGNGGGGNNTGGTRLPGGGVPVCRAGLEVVACPQGTGANRTFWKRKDAK